MLDRVSGEESLKNERDHVERWVTRQQNQRTKDGEKVVRNVSSR